MFTISAQQMEAFRPSMRAKIPEQVVARLRAEGVTAERDAGFGDVLATDVRGFRARMSFYPDGLPKAITPPSGGSFAFEHDAEGRLATIVYPGGDRLEMDRDARGNLTALRRPGLLSYALKYDLAGHLATVKYPDGTAVHVTYHGPGRAETVTDRTGAISHYVWGSSDALRAIIDPLGRRTTYVRDAEGGLAAVVFPDGSRQEFGFDPASKTAIVKLRDGGEVVHELDEADALKAITWADGRRTEFELDGGKLKVARNAQGAVRHTFDAAGSPLTEETPSGTVRYEYDPEGRLLRLDTPQGDAITYEYDGHGRVYLIRDWEGRETRVEYAEDGTVGALRHGNGVVEKHQYARVGRLERAYLITAHGQRISEQAYEYDLCERLTGVVDIWGDATSERRSRRLVYDAESRLVAEIDPATGYALARYVYDAKGNLTDDNGVAVSVGVMDEPRARDGEPIECDRNGNILRAPGVQGENHYSYGADGLLYEVRLGGRTLRFEYDALGRRVLKTDGHRTWRYGWAQHQLLWEEVQERPEGPAVRRDYLYLPNSATPLAFREGARTYWLQSDARGAVIRAFDEVGQVVWRANYDSFGAARVEVAEVRQPFRLAGQYEDEETGLHYNLARYYCPWLKSYLSLDPSWAEEGATNYSYARNDPWNRADPFGTIAPLLLAVGAVAVGGLVGGVISAATGGSFWAGAASGALTTAGAIVGGLLGGPVGLIAGGMVGGALGAFAESAIDQALKGEEICWPCAFKAAGESVLFDIALLGLGKIPGVKKLVKLIGEKLLSQASKIRAWAKKKLGELGSWLAKKLARKNPFKEAAKKKLEKHLADVSAHKKKYEDKLAQAKGANKSARTQGAYKAKLTEARGELDGASLMREKHPDLEMVRGFKPGTGFDQVYVKRGKGGAVEEIVIVEAKGPGASLSKGAKKGDQMDKKWVKNTATKMTNSKDPETRKLGRDILDALENGDPKVTGKVTQSVEGGAPRELPSHEIPDNGTYN
ncbi:RHS repeat-associated core domain-containing protein [Sorangium sp. So ce429]